MKGWLESVAGPEYAAALMWTIVALIVLLVLLLSIRIVRGFATGTFIAGGRNRKTRLAVMDATAVDSHRRLILVRRDDVEHLLLIGGPTDVVVEQNIRLVPAARRPVEELGHHGHGHPAETPAAEQPRPQPRPQHQPEPAPRHVPPAPAAPPRPAAAPATAPVAAPSVASLTPASPARAEPRFSQHLSPAPAARPAAPTPASPAPVAPTQAVRPAMTPVQAGMQPAPVARPEKPDLDDELLKELEVSLDGEHTPASVQQPAAPQPVVKSAADSTLDDEMSKLLSDLAGKR